jgi:hypothetical protein
MALKHRCRSSGGIIVEEPYHAGSQAADRREFVEWTFQYGIILATSSREMPTNTSTTDASNYLLPSGL